MLSHCWLGVRKSIWHMICIWSGLCRCHLLISCFIKIQNGFYLSGSSLPSLSRKTKQQSFYGPLSGTTRVSRYQKKYSPTHHPDHRLIFISLFHLLRSIASSLFKLRAWQSFCTTSLHLLEKRPLNGCLFKECSFTVES